MPDVEDIRWFKQEFGSKIVAATRNTSFTLDMITALACQETGEIWSVLRRKAIPTAEILRLCVGDSLDRPKTFPRDRAHLEQIPRGREVFTFAHRMLREMAAHIRGYQAVAQNPNKFCHGFGIFQFDIQHLLGNEEFFLGGYADFDAALNRCLRELTGIQKRFGWPVGATLADEQLMACAIAYNRGSYDPKRGALQGYRPKGGKYYGEAFRDYLAKAKLVKVTLPEQAPKAEQPVPASPQAVHVSAETALTTPAVAIVREETAGKIRSLPIQPKLRELLRQAATQCGIDVVRVTSGGQAKISTAGKRVGSTRHDEGWAADLQLLIGDRPLSFVRTTELPYFQHFVRFASQLGATGIGAGVDYMGPLTIHVGYGSEAVWGAGGKIATAPAWLRQACAEGKALRGRPLANEAPGGLPPPDRIAQERWVRRIVSARSGLNVRSGPGTNYRRVGVLPAGSPVWCDPGEEGAEWRKVDLGNGGLADGYVFAAYLGSG